MYSKAGIITAIITAIVVWNIFKYILVFLSIGVLTIQSFSYLHDVALCYWGTYVYPKIQYLYFTFMVCVKGCIVE